MHAAKEIGRKNKEAEMEKQEEIKKKQREEEEENRKKWRRNYLPDTI